MHEGQPHPDPIVETATLASVTPPDITYAHHLQVGRNPHAYVFVCACRCQVGVWMLSLPCGSGSDATSPPRLSRSVQEDVQAGELSNAQLETVLYAFQRFNQRLDDGAGEWQGCKVCSGM